MQNLFYQLLILRLLHEVCLLLTQDYQQYPLQKRKCLFSANSLNVQIEHDTGGNLIQNLQFLYAKTLPLTVYVVPTVTFFITIDSTV